LPTDFLEMWYAARDSQFGVVIQISEGDFEKVRQRLYSVRREAADESLNEVSICESPNTPSEVWLVKRKPSNETP
jgi:hypothetical protein